MPALFSDTPISTERKGFILFMLLGLFSHINLRQNLKEVPQNFWQFSEVDEVTDNDAIQKNQHR